MGGRLLIIITYFILTVAIFFSITFIIKFLRLNGAKDIVTVTLKKDNRFILLTIASFSIASLILLIIIHLINS